jgi:glycosyltransferase involved in cell wall biosynthesis
MRTERKEKRHLSLNFRSQESKRLIVRHCGNAHPRYCAYFKRKHGFLDLCRLPRDQAAKSKVAHLRDIVFDLIYILRNLRHIREAREIIAIGPMTLGIALLLKLNRLPSCRRVYWFGLFIHNPRWIRFSSYLFRILDSKRIKYVLFSNFEKMLYHQSLYLNENRMFYIPYGDLSKNENSQEFEVNLVKEIKEEPFFFSGGGSNRDYPSLIEIFRTLPHKLVIICSSLNTEVDESVVPSNIKVLRDVPSETFDAYVIASKACIIPIAHNTGAAGQSCLLRYMKNKKIIIATDTGIIREYVKDGVSGILVKDNKEAMAKAVRAVATNIEGYRSYADAAFERFVKVFSGEAIEQRLDNMINQKID